MIAQLGQKLRCNLDCVKKDINRVDNYDFFGVAYGGVGTGKSTLNALMSSYVQPTYSNKNLFLKPNEWFRNKRFMHKGDAVNFDEVIEFANARESLKGDNVDFTKELTKIRGLGYFIISAISDLKMLDRFVRESRADVFFYIPRRGVVWVYRLIAKHPGEERMMVKRRKALLNGEFPTPDFVDYFGTCYHMKKYWARYMKRKTAYMMQSKLTNKTLVKIQDKLESIERNTVIRSRAAKFLKVTNTTLCRWEKDWRHNPLKRKLRVVKLRQNMRYPVDELNRLGKAMYKGLWDEKIRIDDDKD